MRIFWQRLIGLLRGNRLERELNEEIGIHLAMQEEEFRKQGMKPADARAAALRDFGGVAQTKEDVRDRRGVSWLETAARDLRYGLRGLRRTPGFTLAAVLSLALAAAVGTYVVCCKLLQVREMESLLALRSRLGRR